jgi:oligopeptide/dipeptide ABC transporter ATP-binding protein
MTRPILRATALAKSFVIRRSLMGRPLSTVKAVDGVDLEIRPGETLAIVGESGCGKSTVGRLLLRLIEPTAGRVEFEGRDLTGLAAGDLRAERRHLQLIFQDPYASLNPRMTVRDIVAEPLTVHGIGDGGDCKDAVERLLAQVGLKPEHGDRYPHEFSGGQRQRIVIARALASNPKVIVCDEPVSALDVSIRAQILNLLRDVQRDFGLAMVFISHDLAVVRHIADRVAVMYLGRIVETGTSDRIFADPRHPYTRALLSAIPVPSPAARRNRQLLEGDVPSPIDPPPGCHLHQRCPFAVERCRVERPILVASPGGHAVACHRADELPPAGELVPSISGLDPVAVRLIGRFGAQGMSKAAVDPAIP